MRTCYTTLIILITTLLLTVCSGCSKSSNEQFDFLNRLGINIDDKLVLGDSIVMNDIYCGDPKQDDNEVEGKELTAEQYQALIVPAGIDFTDVMSRWILLGVRDVGNANTLAAYYAGSSSGYCVHLMTYNRQGQLLDAISLRELHLLWRINPMDPETTTAWFSIASWVPASWIMTKDSKVLPSGSRHGIKAIPSMTRGTS